MIRSDSKKTFGSEWIFKKFLTFRRYTQVIITFLKYNIERFHIKTRKKGIFKTYNFDINNRLSQGDSLSSFLSSIDLLPLSTELKNTAYQYKTTPRGVIVIVVGNEYSDSSSNPGRDWLHFI